MYVFDVWEFVICATYHEFQQVFIDSKRLKSYTHGVSEFRVNTVLDHASPSPYMKNTGT